MRRAARRGLLVIGALLLLLLTSLAVPVPAWRRGEPDAPPLTLTPLPPLGTPPIRVWIDADPACGLGDRIDPDDCFAILHLARSPQVRVVGLSSVFGNAPLAATDSVARALRAVLVRQGFDVPPVTGGAASAEDTVRSDAVAAGQA
ncbi:MAG: nucleoside hydrolase, partial [Gemmatimonadota bacterium]|nr:nucleoside hydrolase [Gemmatimonadota bacterium]